MEYAFQGQGHLDVPPIAQRIIDEVELAYPLVVRFQELALLECDRLADGLDDLEGDARERAEAFIRTFDDDSEEAWKGWVGSLDAAGLEDCAQVLRDWMAESIDWNYEEYFPSDPGPQGQALNYFEQLYGDTLDALGVILVYGDRPGSTYCAAELEGDIDEANAAAQSLRLHIRFVLEQKASESSDQVAPSSAPGIAAAEVAPDSGLNGELSRRFEPAFGLFADPVARLFHDASGHRTQPPLQVCQVHDPALFDAAWDRIVRLLREPATVWVDDDMTRHVHVLGTGVYSMARSGLLSIKLWELDRIGCPRLEDADPATISIDPLPHGPRLFARWEQWFALEVGHSVRLRGLKVSEARVAEYAQWAFRVLRNRIRGHGDMRRVRACVARTLSLDVIALEVARRVNVVERAGWASAQNYNLVIGDAAAYRKLMHDAPRLMVMFHLLRQLPGFAGDGEPLQRMREFILARGLSPRCWRMLVKSGPRLLKPMAAYGFTSGPEAALGYLELLDAMRWRGAPDKLFMDLVLGLRDRADEARDKWLSQYASLLPSLRHLVRWFEEDDGALRAQIRRKLHLVLNWLDLEGSADVGNHRRHPDWNWMQRRATAWSERRVVERQHGGKRWPVPADRVIVDDLEIVFIDNAMALSA